VGKLKVVNLSKGESVIGTLEDTGNGMAKLTDRDGETILRISLPDNVIETLDEEVNSGEIVEIVKTGNSFEIFTHDEFPKEREQSK